MLRAWVSSEALGAIARLTDLRFYLACDHSHIIKSRTSTFSKLEKRAGNVSQIIHMVYMHNPRIVTRQISQDLETGFERTK